MDTTVDLTSVREAGNLITVDAALDILRTTEPMEELEFDLDGKISTEFSLPMGWNEEIREKPAGEETECTVKVGGGDEFTLTKEALLKMTSSIGLTKDYVMRTPGPLIQAHLNWWVKNGGVKNAESMRLLAKDGVGVAFIKSSLHTFPNIPVLEKVIEKASERYQTDEFYVDYKIQHDLSRTALRLIVPSYRRTIETARSGGQDDEWSVGIQIVNSLMGEPASRLSISGYLFAWWCTNGSISTHASSGKYNRRTQGQEFDDVMQWVDNSTGYIFEDLEPELDAVESLTDVSLTGELNDVVTDVFRQFRVPIPARKSITDFLVESDDLSGYGLMQAITQSANNPDISDVVREATMQVGGIMPGVLTDRCAACHRVHVS